MTEERTPAPDLSPRERSIVAMFGIHQPEMEDALAADRRRGWVPAQADGEAR